MRALAASALALVLLTGCVSVDTYAPPDSVEFHDVDSLAELEGSYANQGEGFGPHGRYLSSFIWQGDEDLEHSDVDVISVRASGDSVLIVEAISDSGVLRRGRFARGRHFELRSGQLYLNPVREVDTSTEVAWMASTETVVLGIDERGQGKVQDRTHEAGVFLVIPVAGVRTNEYRFHRVGEPER